MSNDWDANYLGKCLRVHGNLRYWDGGGASFLQSLASPLLYFGAFSPHYLNLLNHKLGCLPVLVSNQSFPLSLNEITTTPLDFDSNPTAILHTPPYSYIVW